MIACSVCNKRDALSYFKVERVAADGTTSPLTVACSVKCMSGWLFSYAQLQGARLAFGAKQAIDRIRELFKT